MKKHQRQAQAEPRAGNDLRKAPLQAGVTTPAPEETAARPAAPKAPRPGSEEESRIFFALARMADALREFYSLSGSLAEVRCVPLGHIPGPAALLIVESEMFSILAATPGVVKGPTPLPWVAEEELLPEIKEALRKFQALVEGLDGQEPVYTGSEATNFRRSRELEVPLVMGLTALKWDDRAGPYGLVLLPGVREGTVVVLKAYNPEGFPPSLEPGRSYPVSELLDRPGAAQKLLAVWASFEARYHGKYQAYHR